MPQRCQADPRWQREHILEERLVQLETVLRRIPREPPPTKRSSRDLFNDSPFSEEINAMEIPVKFSFLAMRLYDGTQDPDDNMAYYKQKMMATSLLYQLREACMCKSFGSNLVGSALQWFTNLPGGKIHSFEQFSSSKKPAKVFDDLYEVVQAPRETLKSYLIRLNHEMVAISNCNMSIALSTFKHDLLTDGVLYMSLTKYCPVTMEDAKLKATGNQMEKQPLSTITRMSDLADEFDSLKIDFAL